MGPAQNTDRELWREREGDYYADSIHATARGGIGINCGGHVIVLPAREWHRLAVERSLDEALADYAADVEESMHDRTERLSDRVLRPDGSER